MKSAFVRGLALLLVLMALPALAQRPGGNLGGQRRVGGQRQRGEQTGQQQRQRVRADQQQQKQYQVCAEAMNRLRNRVRQMRRLAAAQSFETREMQALEEQLLTEIQAVEQEQAQLTESLSTEQRAAVHDQLGKIAASQEELDSFAEALRFELDQETPDATQVREELKELDDLAKQLQTQQRELGDKLEIE